MPSINSDILCPKCNNVFNVDLILKSEKQTVQCKFCQNEFKVSFFIVRSKRSKQTKDSEGIDVREFNIRVYNTQGFEELITFLNYDSQDMELKSQDIFTLTYDIKEQIRTASNQTIKQHLRIGQGGIAKGCASIYSIVSGLVGIAFLYIIFKIYSC